MKTINRWWIALGISMLGWSLPSLAGDLVLLCYSQQDDSYQTLGYGINVYEGETPRSYRLEIAKFTDSSTVPEKLTRIGSGSVSPESAEIKFEDGMLTVGGSDPVDGNGTFVFGDDRVVETCARP